MRLAVGSSLERRPERLDRLTGDGTEAADRLGLALGPRVGTGDAGIIQPAAQDSLPDFGTPGGGLKRALAEQAGDGAALPVGQIIDHFRSPTATQIAWRVRGT